MDKVKHFKFKDPFVSKNTQIGTSHYVARLQSTASFWAKVCFVAQGEKTNKKSKQKRQMLLTKISNKDCICMS